MATLATRPVTSTVPPGYSIFPCCLCGVAIAVDDHSPEAPTCRSCLRVGAESAIAEATNVLAELRAGSGVFAVLSPAERAEQICQLIGEIPAPALVRASMKHLPDDRLIRIIAETSDVVVMGAAAVELS